MKTEFLERLRCPVTRSRLHVASDELLARLRAQRERGALVSVQGEPVGAPWQALLVTENADRAYPIQDGIPVLLPDQAIAIPD